MRVKYKILKQGENDYNLPLFLESSVDEMGVLSPFDGDMIQIDQVCNFTYFQIGNTVDLLLSVNTQKYTKLIDVEYIIDWGDGSPLESIIATDEELLPTLTHVYPIDGVYEISISFMTPWDNKKTTKNITIPQDLSQPNPLGNFTTLIVPSYLNLNGQVLSYINDLDNSDKVIGIDEDNPTFTFRAFGKSRISEKKKYGSLDFIGVTTGTTVEGVEFKEYVIDGLTYRDFEDGITEIIGTVPNAFHELPIGFTEITTSNENDFEFISEYITNNMLTRDEYLIGFIDEPTVYSDIFVDRGKLGVGEFNLRLSEIDNLGELTIYGNGFFNIKKQ